ncbi:hypothetical protein G6F31_020992 [Rhizopus arrhizus]|nr:hypothetical protein G6F31_020992 [Rhizopus arrhizus]
MDIGSVYVSYSQAAQPSALGASTNTKIYGATGSDTYKPAVSKTWELGTKWNLAGSDLALTGAVFRTELTDSWDAWAASNWACRATSRRAGPRSPA